MAGHRCCNAGIITERNEGFMEYMASKIEYRRLGQTEINRELFDGFVRTQPVTQCWRKEQGEWLIKDIAFVDDWGEPEYETLVSCLRNTAATGGLVTGAFLQTRLVGFAAVEREPIGSRGQYLDLSSIHVSQDMRGYGIGKRLFHIAAGFAREKGAAKLYISAHSSVESQAFYRAMNCKEAEEYHSGHVEQEPCDCQLECQVADVNHKEIVKYFYEKVVSGNLLEELSLYVSEDCTLKIGEKIIPLGLEGMRQHLIDVKKTYPDYTMKLIRQYSEGDYVISEFIMEGTHEGEWIGIKPTNKRLVFTGVDIDKVVDGKIVEHGGAVNTFDTLYAEHLIQPV